MISGRKMCVSSSIRIRLHEMAFSESPVRFTFSLADFFLGGFVWRILSDLLFLLEDFFLERFSCRTVFLEDLVRSTGSGKIIRGRCLDIHPFKSITIGLDAGWV